MYETFIGIGIITSLIYNEITDISPGGLITPGYFALFIDQPLKILMTLMIALLTYFIVRFLSKYLPIYGKRRFAVCVIVAITLKLTFSSLVMQVGDSTILISSIGLIIPGLISSDMLKQNVTDTLISLSIVTGLLYVILLISRGLMI